MDKNIIEIKALSIEYLQQSINGTATTFRAVNNLSIDIKSGEVLAIAGESGCGKSTLAKAMIKLIKPIEGEVFFNDKNIEKLNHKDKKNFTSSVQMVFQNPYHSLNPKMKIYDILKESLDINTKLSRSEKKQRIEQIIKDVGLPVEALENYPHEFSGGQRQRIAIARALILKPQILIADEPVSALDASIQAQILNLLNDLKKKYNLTIIFISHDLRVIKYLADRVAVMYLGEIQEIGTVEDIFNDPKHPYTRTLLDAIPEIGKPKAEILNKEIEISSTTACKFAPRCTRCINDKCKESPNLMRISPTHSVRCSLYKD